MKKLALVVLLFPIVALAQEAGPIDGALAVLNSINDGIGNNSGMIGGGMSILLLVVAKIFSNEKAGPVVHLIQKIVDGVARCVIIVGEALLKISELLANAIKSDGLLGKK